MSSGYLDNDVDEFVVCQISGVTEGCQGVQWQGGPEL